LIYISNDGAMFEKFLKSMVIEFDVLYWKVTLFFDFEVVQSNIKIFIFLKKLF